MKGLRKERKLVGRKEVWKVSRRVWLMERSLVVLWVVRMAGKKGDNLVDSSVLLLVVK